MAEQALKKLEEQLSCPICLDTYTDPKQLHCHHVFCQQCLVPLVVRDQQGKLGLTCPNCRHVTPIPDRGVAGLQPAFYINHFLEIQDAFKNLSVVESVGGTSADTPQNTPSRNVLQYCFKHEKEELRLYCDTCEELVCFQCIMKSGKHHDHDYALLHEAFEKHKKEIATSLDPMEKQVAAIKKALAQLYTCSEEICDQRTAIEDNIHVTFRRLREVLNVRETELIGQLDQLTQGKLKGLAAQRDQVETTLAQLISCLLFMRESLRTDNERYLLRMKTNTVEQMKVLTTLFQPDLLKPDTEADMAFSALADLTAACQNYGLVFTSGPDPSNCNTTGNCAIVGETSAVHVILQAIDRKGGPCEVPIKSLECELVSELTGTRAKCSVKRRGLGQYEISYQPTIKGRHQLHISRYSIAVSSPTLKLGTPILTIDGIEEPWGVAITQTGDIVVTELGRHCVSVFSPSGEKLRSFGKYGFRQGLFIEPRGVTVDGEGNILVADCRNNRIQKFTVEGQFVAAVGTRGSGPLQFTSPSRIEFNASNNKLYVADGNRVQVLNSDLTFFGTFGEVGSGKGQFHSDYLLGGIACDSTGNVYVTDFGNTRIQVFTPEGKFLRMFGRPGQGRGELHCPVGVAIDTSDRVYVSENGNQRVSVFTSEGQFVTSFGTLNRPRGLMVDNSGVVYVCDCQNNLVQVF